jgi:hypothetical protein
MDVGPLQLFMSDFIDELPTEATFRGEIINVRIGEAPKTRELLIAGFQPAQAIEALMKTEDVDDTEPAIGETVTIGDVGFKIGSVSPLLSFTCPAAYRLNLSRIV